MKRNKTFLLSAMLCMAGLTAGAQESSRLSFGVISDIHFENGVGEGAMVKVPKTLKNLSSHGTFDALAVVGDLTNNGNEDQFQQLVQVFTDPKSFTNPVGELLFMMGNHDQYNASGQTYYQDYLKVFNGNEAYPLHSYRTIKGYAFITVSMLTTGNNAYPYSTQEWLKTHLAKAAEECPGKPIFVFAHVPPAHSCYSTWPEWENGVSWGTSALNAVLNKYPQAVVFGGHSHYPVGDPRSIHQGTNPASGRQNFFTAINTGSVTYSEIHPGAVDAGIHPAMYDYVTEGLIVNELENGNIEIRRYDTYRNEEIAASQRWVLEAPFDGSMFRYADIRDADDNPDNRPIRDGLPAPVFTESTALAVIPTAYDAKVTIPQATDNECVFRYAVNVKDGETGVVVAQSSIFSQFYLNSEMPATIECVVDGLDPETDYEVEVIAYDSYDNASEPLTATFSTPEDNDEANEVPDPENRWTFDNKNYPLSSDVGNSGLEPLTFSGSTMTVCNNAEEAGMSVVEGPSEENFAVRLPKNAGFKSYLYLAEATKNYTLLMDVRVQDAGNYNALFQTNLENTDDAECFLHKNTIGVGDLGYSGHIEANTWHRVLFVNRDGQFTVYVDGKKISTASRDRWTIQSEGVLLFVDNDGERVETEVAEVAFWNTPFTMGQIRRLGNVAVDEYVNVLTPSVKLFDDTDFSVTVKTNTAISFEMPEWIEAVDAVPALGTKDYTFRAKPMTEAGKRTGTISVLSENLPAYEVTVTQTCMGTEIPTACGVWTFDNPDDLLGGTGVSTMHPAVGTLDGVGIVSLEESGIVPLEEGPAAGNGAIGLPVYSYLWVNSNLGDEPTGDYTIMMDIRPEKLDGYNALFLNNTDTSKDGSIFIKNGGVGLNGYGLGYNGQLEQGVWHRIVLVGRNSYIRVYVDGKKVGECTSPHDRGTLYPQWLLFADNDGEELWTDVAEVRFWDVPLTDAFVSELGKVEQKEILPDPVPEPTGLWTFDDAANPLFGTGVADLFCAVKGEDGKPTLTEDLTAAGLVATEGPSADNGAVTVPIDTYLSFNHNEDRMQLNTFSFLMDIRPKQLGGFQSLYQSNPNNNADASLFIKDNQIGLNSSGLGYSGNLESGKWHRVVFTVEGGTIGLYLDGIRISGSSTSNSTWSLYDGSLFFADENGEEGVIDIAELRYWNDVLSPSMVKQLGTAGDAPTGIDAVESAAPTTGTYDLMGRKLNPANLQKGIYIRDGRKVVVN